MTFPSQDAHIRQAAAALTARVRSTRRTIAAMLRALFTLLVLFGMPSSTLAEDAKRLTALLLVSRAELPDPNFKDSVVFVTNQMRRAPVGVIINKPTKIPVSQLFPDLERLAGSDDRVYFGGPVDPRT